MHFLLTLRLILFFHWPFLFVRDFISLATMVIIVYLLVLLTGHQISFKSRQIMQASYHKEAYFAAFPCQYFVYIRTTEVLTFQLPKSPYFLKVFSI